MRTVGEVSQLSGVSIRALHHYDEVGLLRPSERSEAGYRLYGHADLERLQEILVWRTLGFSLKEIKGMLDDPGHDRLTALRRQRELVEHELERLGATARALDAALADRHRGTRQEEPQMFRDFDPTEYEEEARDRWGDTDAYRESARRTASYTDADWEAIRREADAVVGEFADAMAAGEPAEGDRARTTAERHRHHISRWFYPVSTPMHRNLAELYLADPHFAERYDRTAPGLAAYVHDAIVANADAIERSGGLST